MGSNDDGVWAAARAIRPYLAGLVGQDVGLLDDRSSIDSTAQPSGRTLSSRSPATRGISHHPA
jgi:hypothetical protein